ncbi:MAG TPA: biosynthetic peptidoglycan transglycosylase, partial [Polyangiaceae bacterium]|nr:biosynthetic peptidoglycan transglycosylase [Polyangiaceae bacterium]
MLDAARHSVKPVEWGRTGSMVEPNEAKPEVDLASKYGIKPVSWGRTSDTNQSQQSLGEGVAELVVAETPRWKKILYWCLGIALGLLALAVLTVWLVIEHHEAGLPNAKQLRHAYRPQQVTRVLARDGTILSEIFTERRTVVPFESIPPHTKLAFLAAEDARFYEHEGLNYLGMLRALLVNLRAGRTVQGGSTITQQVVKNVHLDSKRTYARKIQETILARRLEQSLTKDEILSLYLNHIYLG